MFFLNPSNPSLPQTHSNTNHSGLYFVVVALKYIDSNSISGILASAGNEEAERNKKQGKKEKLLCKTFWYYYIRITIICIYKHICFYAKLALLFMECIVTWNPYVYEYLYYFGEMLLLL